MRNFKGVRVVLKNELPSGKPLVSVGENEIAAVMNAVEKDARYAI